METLKPNTEPIESNDEDVHIPDTMTDDEKVWFYTFVNWYKKHYSPQLDPDNIPNIIPRTSTEAILLNYLQFHDKYIDKRCTFEERNIIKCHQSDSVIGSDKEIHTYAYLFTRYGPNYFIDNTDVRGKTEQELEYLKTKPWCIDMGTYRIVTNPCLHHEPSNA